MNPKQLLTLATVSFLSLSIASGFTVTSPAFKQGATIPTRFTCDGAGSSFPLAFGTPPAGTKSFAILGWDDDAPTGLANQWAAYDIPLVRTAMVRTADEAMQRAGEVGYPLVLKIDSPDIAHRSDVGGVELGIANREAALLLH